MEVYNHLGCGFQEFIYQRALAYEFDQLGLEYAREHDVSVKYKNIEIGTRRVDFLVSIRIVIELKAVRKLENVHLAQAKNYLESYVLPIGLLINFGADSLEYKRIFNRHLQ